ncbi:FtsX-like permease family protein [Streptosporangium sandarakinum]|uniref:FtsX-like permease family protein n=1 Tax=Streptosporangium sandarakinum TaxID=1260955 RepID=UPI00371D250D
MLSVAWSTLRTRRVSFLGTFLALALGTALIAAMGQLLAVTVDSPDRGPQRYAAAPFVIVPDGRVHVRTWRGEQSLPLVEKAGLDAELVARSPGAVVDRAFPARLAGGPDVTGRPWAARRTAPQRLLAGRAPRSPREIAVSTGARVGDTVTVLTRAGAESYTVVGVTDGPPTVFFTDRRAAALSPRVDALALWSAPGGTLPPGTRLLTGQDRALADPSREDDARARDNAVTIVGIAAGFAVFIAVFVVSSTFAFAVAQRRREFALLRTLGATRRQVRLMVYGEALLVAVAASALGAPAGPALAGPILDRLVGLGMAPSWLVPGTYTWPSVTAFCVGAVVALAGVAVAAARAGRVHPAEAMREAVVEPGVMTWGRRIFGVGLLGAALASMVVTAVRDPLSAANDKSFMPVVMLLVTAAGLLAPAVVRPVTRLVAAPLGRLRGAGATVVTASATASARRTAATAAPVLVAVGLATALLGAAAMNDAAKAAMRTAPVRADYLVLPEGAAGLDDRLLGRLRDVPGVEVVAAAPTGVYTLEGATALIRRPAEAMDPAGLVNVLAPPVTAGSLTALNDRTIAVSETWELALGDTAKLWRADGSQVSLKVVALLGAGSPADSYVTPAHAFSAPVTTAYVRLRPGTSPDAAGSALRRAAAGHDVRVLTRDAWARATGDRHGSASRLGLLVVLGIILAYTAIALVNTLLMAASDRTAERAALRLLGATRGQVLRYAMGESLLVVAVGVVLAAAVAAVGLAGLWGSLVQIAGPVAVSVPWPEVGAVAAGCAALAALSAAAPLLRRG